MILEAIILGLSSGAYCCMYCGPVLIPFLAGRENCGGRRNALLTATFLAARLAMYFALGAVFAGMGLLARPFMDPVLARRLSYWAYLFCGIFLLANSLGLSFPWGTKNHGGCKCPALKRAANDWLAAALTGLSVGLHVCPPLWTAMARSFFERQSFFGAFYFVFFYVGTLPYFVPLLGIPFLTKIYAPLKQIARIAQLLMAVYFLFFMGVLPLIFN